MAGYKNFFKQLELAERKAQGRFLTEVNLLSPAQRGVQQYLYTTVFMYCVEGKGDCSKFHLSVCQCRFYRQEWSEGTQEGSQPGGQARPWAQVPAQNPSVPVVIPKVEEEKRTRVA